MRAVWTRVVQSLVILTLFASGSLAAAKDAVHEQFFEFLEEICLPAIETGTAPDLGGFTAFDRNNPNHHYVGPSLGDGFVAEDPRLLIAFSEINGYRACEVSFADRSISAVGKAITNALETWTNTKIEQTDYSLIDNCALFGFKFLIVAGSPATNPRGHYVRIAAHAAADHEDQTLYGNPRVVVGEAPMASTLECEQE